MVHPNDIILDGWDISSMNMADAMSRAKVMDIQLQEQLRPLMKDMKPRPAIYDPDFIAANQSERADNVIKTKSKLEQVEQIRHDIRDFKAAQGLDTVMVLWTANTERYCDVQAGVHDTADNLLAAIRRNEPEISPSTLYAVACVLEGVTYINGSPQNTFVPGLIELAEKKGVFIAGDDFKVSNYLMKPAANTIAIESGAHVKTGAVAASTASTASRRLHNESLFCLTFAILSTLSC